MMILNYLFKSFFYFHVEKSEDRHHEFSLYNGVLLYTSQDWIVQ
jgi:hypothetical protein